MTLRCVLAVGVLASLTATPASAQQRIDALFDEAGEHFTQGRPDDASAAYARLVEAGVVDADVFHNQGTALASSGRYGEAVLAFERALHLDPGADDTRASLESTERVLADRLTAARGEVETHRSSGLSEALVRDISERAVAIGFLALWALAFLFLGLRKKGVAFAAMSAVFFLSAATLGVLLMAKRGVFRDGDPAVITAREASLLEGPDPRSVDRGDAYEGERAAALRRDSGYVFVRTGDGRSGWLPEAAVGLIEVENGQS
ncbi:MAG: tetratricopeptide repeat protein [Myxococcota bacterium]